MHQLLKLLLSIFEQGDPVERDRRFSEQFVPQACQMFLVPFHVHLDFSLLPEDEWDNWISGVMQAALRECQSAARTDQITSLARSCATNAKLKLGTLEFDPLAAAIAQLFVRSDWSAFVGEPMDFDAFRTESPAEDSLQPDQATRQITPLELEMGPDLMTVTGQFVDAVRVWTPDSATNPAVPASPPSHASAPSEKDDAQFKLRWQQIRQRLLKSIARRSGARAIDDGIATDLMDRILQKALIRKDNPDKPVRNAYAYLRKAFNNLLADTYRQGNRRQQIDEARSQLDLTTSPSPEDAATDAEIRQKMRQQMREAVSRLSDLDQELILAAFWDDFNPRIAAQKIYYLCGLLRTSKAISEKTIKARKRLEDHLRDLGF